MAFYDLVLAPEFTELYVFIQNLSLLLLRRVSFLGNTFSIPIKDKLGVVGVMGVNVEAKGVEVIITDRNLQKKIMCVR